MRDKEEKCKEDEHEENIKMEFDEIREQKKEIVKGMSEKVYMEENIDIVLV